jgi:hypothetical protein
VVFGRYIGWDRGVEDLVGAPGLSASDSNASCALIAEVFAMSGSITIRLDDPEAADRIDALAKAMDRSRNWVLNRAVDEYLAVQSWQIAKIVSSQRNAVLPCKRNRL